MMYLASKNLERPSLRSVFALSILTNGSETLHTLWKRNHSFVDIKGSLYEQKHSDSDGYTL